LTTLVTPSLVFCKVSIVYTLILILQTFLLTSTTLLVIRVLHLMTLVCSIAHTFLSKWFVPLVRTPSSPRSDSRPATEWFLTHSLRVHLLTVKVLVVSRQTATATTEEYVLTTSCDLLDPQGYTGGANAPLFLSK